jgi:mono/diheme cytochrome c family protein
MLAVVGAVLMQPGTLWSQLGDRPDEGPQVPPTEAARHPMASPALSPEEELKTFKLPPGFKIELLAADPVVQDPVAAAYDREGNLWEVEFGNFNSGMIRHVPSLTAGVKESEIPSSKLVKLESSNHDGLFDRRTVWLDHLSGAKGIMIVRDGILISDPPHLWLARDVHGTGHCDEKVLILDNYEAWDDPEESGSLLWGRDNVIHDIDFSYDYRYRNRAMERIAVPIRGQFGITQDDFGRLYYCRSTDHARCDFYSSAYGLRNPNVPEVPWDNVQIAESQEVWPSHPNVTNRGYRIGRLGWHTDGVREDGTLLEFTAACSPLIYRGANFPSDFYGNDFTPEPAGNLIKRDVLRESGGRIDAVSAYAGSEFLTSTDSRFRPVALLNCPDGSMVVVDMYRGILEEYHFITSYLREQSLARGLEKPMFGLGRIWKITYQGGPLESRRPDLDQMSSSELTGLLRHPDAWWRDTAQQEIVERGDWSAVRPLQDLARGAPDPITRVYALWTLDGLGAASLETLKTALGDASPKVRAVAVRLHERFLTGSAAETALGQLLPVISDAQPEVLVQLGLSLGEMHSPNSLDAMYKLLTVSRNVPDLPSALATGLAGHEYEFLQRLVADLGPAGQRPELDSMLTILSTAIVHEGDQRHVHQLIAAIVGERDLAKSSRAALFRGLNPLLEPDFRRSIGPTRILSTADLAPLLASPDQEIRAGAEKLTAFLAKAEASRQDASRKVPLTAAEKVRYDKGMIAFQICVGCHQSTGTGLSHVAPSLVDSHWVSSFPEIAVRIVLCGKEGTPGFPGPMPPIGGTFTDEQIADVLTYVRNSWDLHLGAVAIDTVEKVRAAVGNRQAPWTDAELGRVENAIAVQRDHAASRTH